jgi:hypothetical protein
MSEVVFMFCAVRVKKFKSKAVGHLQAHNQRSAPQPHTDPSKSHLNKFKILGGFSDFSSAINAKITQLAIKQKRKVRSDAVVLVDVVLVASPEFFRPHDPNKWGDYDDKQLKAYTDASLKFLKDKFGDRVISLSLHLDECTPHLSAAVVPITEDGRLSGKDMFNKFELSKLQDDYYEAMKHLGLNRGIKNTKKAHTEAKDYYKQLGNAKESIKQLTATLTTTASATLQSIKNSLNITTPAKPTASIDQVDNQFSKIFNIQNSKNIADSLSTPNTPATVPTYLSKPK